MKRTATKTAVMALSGGMDSTSLLLHLLSKGYEVTAISFNYGQKHVIELERAASLIDRLPGRSQHLGTPSRGRLDFCHGDVREPFAPGR